MFKNLINLLPMSHKIANLTSNNNCYISKAKEIYLELDHFKRNEKPVTKENEIEFEKIKEFINEKK